MDRMETIVAETKWKSAFDLIPGLMEVPGLN
jgi:hypothetical protein